MKKIVLCLSMALLLLTGCSGEKYPDFLTENSWGYDNKRCAESLYFGEDGEFVYSEACGSPVGNYDAYDEYKYDEKNQTITLIPCEGSSAKEIVKIFHYDEASLMLQIGGKVKEFYAENNVPDVEDRFLDDIEGYSGYNAICKIEDGQIYVGSSEFDGDAQSEEVFRPYKMAQKITFESLSVKTVYKGDTENSTFDHSKLTQKEVESDLENQFQVGFVWYNEDIEVTKVLFYGTTEVYE